MKGVLKYPGAKNRIAEWICGNIPQHNVYLEPFLVPGPCFLINNQPKLKQLMIWIITWSIILRYCVIKEMN